MRQTLTYTPHVTLHPVESTVDQNKQVGERRNTVNEGEMKGKEKESLRMRIIKMFLWRIFSTLYLLMYCRSLV